MPAKKRSRFGAKPLDGLRAPVARLRQVTHADAVGGDNRYFDAVDERVQRTLTTRMTMTRGVLRPLAPSPSCGKRWNHINQLGVSSQNRRTDTGHQRS